MAGEHQHYEFQLRQRITSTALNRQDLLTARAAYEALRRSLSGDQQFLSGVVDGLMVTVVPGTMNVQVNHGLALWYDNSFGIPDSNHRWIEVLDGAPITVTLDPGDASARWDVIEIAPGSASGPGEILDFYDSNTGQFTPLIASPEKICQPVVTVRKGTPGGSPRFPAGVADVIPLAYIYVPPLAAVLDVGDVCYTRPILRPHYAEVTPGVRGFVQNTAARGGGVKIASAGLVGALAEEMHGTFTRATHAFYIPKDGEIRLSVNNYDGGGLPAASGVVYFYAVPVPYPTGYSANLAPREHYISNARMTSGGFTTDQHGCMVIASIKTPKTTQRGDPTVAANFSVNHPNMSGFMSIPTTQAVYIGSAFYDQPAGQLEAQRVFQNKVGGPRKAGADLTASLPIAAPTQFDLTNEITGEADYALPSHVRYVRVVGYFEVSIASSAYCDMTDQFETAGGNEPTLPWSVFRDAGIAQAYFGPDKWVHLDDSQRLVVNAADIGAGGDARLYVYEFEDPILALR